MDYMLRVYQKKRTCVQPNLNRTVQVLSSGLVKYVEDCWERSPTSTNQGVDREFISKEYISIGIRSFRETKNKVMRAYGQSRQYRTIVESRGL